MERLVRGCIDRKSEVLVFRPAHSAIVGCLTKRVGLNRRTAEPTAHKNMLLERLEWIGQSTIVLYAEFIAFLDMLSGTERRWRARSRQTPQF